MAPTPVGCFGYLQPLRLDGAATCVDGAPFQRTRVHVVIPPVIVGVDEAGVRSQVEHLDRIGEVVTVEVARAVTPMREVMSEHHAKIAWKLDTDSFDYKTYNREHRWEFRGGETVRAKAAFFSGCKSHPATIAPAGSNRSSHGGNEMAEASGVEGHIW